MRGAFIGKKGLDLMDLFFKNSNRSKLFGFILIEFHVFLLLNPKLTKLKKIRLDYMS